MPISPSVRIGVTLGDPAGIGPEVAVKAAFRHFKAASRKDFLFIGDAVFYNRLAERLRLPRLFREVSAASLFPGGRSIGCISCGDFPERVRLGQSDNRLTTLAVRAIELGARLAMLHKIDALVTPPINKAGLRQAGFVIPGHTEFLAALSKTKDYEMMLVGGKLRVVLATRHIPIQEVSRRLTRGRIEAVIALADRELRKSFGIRRPRLVVCGLNPHAGESGHIGREEIDVIGPAVRRARRKTNAEIVGPLSPDALFHDAYDGRYDAEICMYHDQGLIPLKMISRGAGVNVTLGLPFVRTSPDHGTGYDIAARFSADAGSMAEAMHLARTLCLNRWRHA